MLFEYCYGVIPLQKRDYKWFVLVIQHQKGHWAFPKGHAETNETAQVAATRELKEETGLDVIGFLSPLPLEEHYKIIMNDKVIMKTVSYFLAVVDGEISLQEEEISKCEWVPVEEAENLVTFDEAKMICKLVCGHINSIQE